MKLETPLIIVNFKTYKSATAAGAVKLAKICDKISKKTGFNVVVAVQGPDIYRVKEEISISVLAEHIDPVSYGGHTGHIIPEDIKLNGAVGSLINHSEDRVGFVFIEKSIERLRELGLVSIVCAQNIDIALRVALMKPDFIAIEPPDLIGGNISVSTANPELIKETVEEVKRIFYDIGVLCGAGIKKKQDVKTAYKLGVDGILLASGITKAENPGEVLEDLIFGFVEPDKNKSQVKVRKKKVQKKTSKKKGKKD